ncbi:MAG: hypothetical protein LBT05_11275 [Planctomycetaceae bacterium]|jgi:hypothetical protein|nr:hypothetical protein [Planctomycetaceae bacterium]
MFNFYILSLLSGFFEIGPLVYIYQQGGNLAFTLFAVLCYQIGNLVPCPLRLSGKITLAVSSLSLFCFGIALSCFPPFPLQYVILSIAVLFASAVIQSLRSVKKSNSPQLIKRTTRIIGFASGFLWAFSFVPIIALISLVFVAGIAFKSKKELPIRTTFLSPKTLTKLNWAMIFHQLHYFVYCYAALLFACHKGGIWIALMLWVLTWLTYTYSEKLPFYQRTNYYNIFITGHILLLGVLLGMFFIENDFARIILWCFTGCGATTVFCFKKINPQDINITFAENIGHVLGILLCLIIFISFNNLIYTLPAAAIFVLIALLLMGIERRKIC